MPPKPAAFRHVQLLLALLVCDTAAGLASGLAGSLALTAATVLSAVAQVAGLDGLNMFHGITLQFDLFSSILAQAARYVNPIFAVHRRGLNDSSSARKCITRPEADINSIALSDLHRRSQ